MRVGRAAVLIVTLSLPAGLVGQQSSASADVQLKAAMQAELVDGDLRKAIDEYRAIVTRFSDSRKVVAAALLQLAGCYEKLGLSDARKTYEQIVREYADQSEPVGRARARLAALGAAAPTAASALTVTALPRVSTLNDIHGLSPDGTKALYLDFDKGQNLAFYDYTTRQTKLLTDFDWSASYVLSGVWSPDGRRVAYTQMNSGPSAITELRVATLTGDSRVIFRNEVNPGKGLLAGGWLPDGRTLLVALERADGTAAIGLIPDAGGSFTPLRSLSWSGKVFRPRVSPDGRFVAFAEGAPGMEDVHVIGVDGRAAYRITDRPGDDVQPVWSPDGRHLAFISVRAGAAALWAVPIRDGQAVGEPARIKDGMEGVELLDWTARGLAYTNHLQTLDIYTVSIDRATWQPVGEARLLPYSRTGRNTAPVWSPDGRFFAFVSGSPAELDRRYIVVSPEGAGDAREYLIPTTRYGNGLEPYDLRWSGDGSGLGFSGTDRQGQTALFYLSMNTGEWQTYPSPVKTWTRVEWNGDGTKVFYARHSFAGDASPGIIERDLTTGAERVVYRPSDNQGTFRGLRLDRNRRLLAFTIAKIAEGRPWSAVLVVDVETGQARTMTEEQSGATLNTTVSLGVPAWSPDGRALIVPRFFGGSSSSEWPEFRVLPLDGTSPRPFAVSPPGRQLSKPAGGLGPGLRDSMWSPDGTRMAYMVATFRTDTWIIENALAGIGSTGDRR